MGLRNSYAGLDPYAARLIQCRTHQLVREREFPECDRDDIEQELALDLLRRLPHFDPRRARRETFIARVVEHRVYELIGARNAARRSARRNGASVHDQPIDNRLRGRRAGGADRDEAEAVELRLDVETVVQGLAPARRDICLRLQDTSITQAARSTGIPRTTLYDVIARVRPSFEQGLLDEYVRARRPVEHASK